MTHHCKQRQRGFSLLELVAVIGIIAILSVGILGYSTSTTSDAKARNEIETISYFIAKIQSTFVTSDDYSDLSNATMYSTLPDHLKGSGTNIQNAFSKSGITLASTSSDTQWQITSTGVPEAACVDIGAKFSGNSNIASFAINGSAVTSPSSASSACNTGTSNTMVYAGN